MFRSLTSIMCMSQEAYQYKDPITELLSCLYIDYDFDGAQEKLRQCEKVFVFVLIFLYVNCR